MRWIGPPDVEAGAAQELLNLVRSVRATFRGEDCEVHLDEDRAQGGRTQGRLQPLDDLAFMSLHGDLDDIGWDDLTSADQALAAIDANWVATVLSTASQRAGSCRP